MKSIKFEDEGEFEDRDFDDRIPSEWAGLVLDESAVFSAASQS